MRSSKETSKFKEDTRVAVYGNSERTKQDHMPFSKENPMAYRYGDKGTVLCDCGDYGVSVKLDKGGDICVHPKQLSLLLKKRIKKKAKK